MRLNYGPIEVNMPCLPSFKALRGRLTIVTTNGRNKIDNTYDDIVEIVKLLLRGVAFDEPWYLARYPDVAKAVEGGTFRSGHHHFITTGYFEGRRPLDFEVDGKWYVETYRDVAEGIYNGTIESAQQHFNERGYAEGRLPAEWKC